MKIKQTLVTTTAGLALILGFAAAPALAQLGTIDLEAVGAGDFTTANVAVEDPFGDLEVDTAVTDPAAIGTALGTWTNEQLTELAQRCAVISENATVYSADAVAYCAAALPVIGTPAAGEAPAAPAGEAPAPAPAPAP